MNSAEDTKFVNRLGLVCLAGLLLITGLATLHGGSQTITLTEGTNIAASVSPLESVKTNGRRLKSTLTISSVKIRVPTRSAWSRMAIIKSGPITPRANPGKFSTSVVRFNCPNGNVPKSRFWQTTCAPLTFGSTATFEASLCG